MIALDVLGVRVELPANTPLVLLREREGARRLLPILIGTSEASAIHTAMEGITPPRPLTHDLLAAVVESSGAHVEHVVVTEVIEHTYYAELHLRRASGEAAVVSCRPSDSIALAVRVGCPIYATDSLLDEAGVPAEEDADDAVEAEDPDRILDEFRDFLDDLRPEDFE